MRHTSLIVIAYMLPTVGSTFGLCLLLMLYTFPADERPFYALLALTWSVVPFVFARTVHLMIGQWRMATMRETGGD